MTVYKAARRGEPAWVTLVRRVVWLLGYVIVLAAATTGGVGIALGQGELVALAGCAIVAGLSVAVSANTVGRRK